MRMKVDRHTHQSMAHCMQMNSAPRPQEPLAVPSTTLTATANGNTYVGFKAPVDAMLPVEGGEDLCKARHPLRRAEEQDAVWFKGIVEGAQDVLLQLGFHVDQEVAAGDQVEF